MSQAEIDQYLTSDLPPRHALWVPGGLTPHTHSAAAAHHSLPAGTLHRPVSAESTVDAARHSAPAVIVQAVPKSHGSLVELEHPGSSTRDDGVRVGYGTAAGGAGGGLGGDSHMLGVPEDVQRLLRSHSKISRVAIPCAFLFGTAFVVALCYNNPPHTRAGVQQLATMDMPSGFACPNFLCPHSGTCAVKASKCPEGNPFLKNNGAYKDLLSCGGENEICTCKSKVAPTGLDCGHDAELMLHKWSSELSGGCSHILCPQSGVCVTNPAMCSEGNPFLSHSGPYFTEAMVAKAVLSERAALRTAKEKKKEERKAEEELKRKQKEAAKAEKVEAKKVKSEKVATKKQSLADVEIPAVHAASHPAVGGKGGGGSAGN